MATASGKLEIGGLEWLEQVHQDLVDHQYAKALRAIEFAIEKLRSKPQREAEINQRGKDCPDCLGSGFKPTGPERNAPHVKCDHRGQQPILKAETSGIEILF